MTIPTSNAVSRPAPSITIAVAALMVAAVVLLSGCGKPADAKAAVTPGKVRAQLNVGYSLLYQQAGGIPKMKWILMLKDKPERLDETTTGLMDYYKQLALSLEKVAAQNPALRLDATTMPELLVDTRKAIGADLAKDFAPLVGDTGLKFERELLLMFYNALDEQRHLVGVMIELEPEPALQSFLEKTRTQLEGRRSKLEDQLNRHYFRQDAG